MAVSKAVRLGFETAMKLYSYSLSPSFARKSQYCSCEVVIIVWPFCMGGAPNYNDIQHAKEESQESFNL